ncbi:hypothetical protein [Actinoplanes sp. DH11]|uniref:hypothetical protein n=1 Tax=Actinoplanes sp. DH11 TaxID=2857011 RepID=UPI001E5C6ACB|nr:hypothetical protein [Actinoplanes sp. DH11]
MTLAVTLTGCTRNQEEPVQPAYDQATAINRVDQLIQQAATALTDGATITFSDGGDDSLCDGFIDSGPAGRVFVEKRYTVVPPSGGTWPEEQVIPDLAAYWEQQHYRVHDDRRTEPDIPTYIVETPDGYRVSVAGYNHNDHYDYTLSASSPCLASRHHHAESAAVAAVRGTREISTLTRLPFSQIKQRNSRESEALRQSLSAPAWEGLR